MQDSSAKKTLVIVEDHGVAGAGLQFMLARDGRFAVLQIVQRGDRPRRQSVGLDPDLLILDIALPVKAGWRFTKPETGRRTATDSGAVWSGAWPGFQARH